ncbi:MAG TPA: OmpH family outer membrane protein [Minicystis sp.]|nr:OmpH family outer membrane protein [Minicystis sp.]
MRAPFLRTAAAAAVAVATLAASPAAHAAAPAPKIIVVDMRRAILDTEDGLRVQAALRRLADARRAEIDRLAQAFQQQQQAVQQKVQAGTPQAQLQPELQHLQETYVQLAQKQNELQNEMAGREQQLENPIYLRIRAIVQQVAQREGADFIVDRAAAAYVRADLEITDRVIQMYNSGAGTGAALPGPQPPATPPKKP